MSFSCFYQYHLRWSLAGNFRSCEQKMTFYSLFSFNIFHFLFPALEEQLLHLQCLQISSVRCFVKLFNCLANIRSKLNP